MSSLSALSLLTFLALTSFTFVGASVTMVQFMGELVKAGVTRNISVANQSACTDLCTGNVSAVSYSDLYKLCITSQCGRLVTKFSAPWMTFTCRPEVFNNSCSYRKPKLEWMLTDSCGMANTGWYNPGWIMKAQTDFKPIMPNYTIAVSPLFGNAIKFPNATNYYGMTDPADFAVNFSQPFTMFAAFNVATRPTASSSPFLFMEIGKFDESLRTYSIIGPQFWMESTGITFNIINSTASISVNVDYNLGATNYAAVVYEPGTIINVTTYFNGQLVGKTKFTTPMFVGSFNVVAMASRPKCVENGYNTRGALDGAVYCLKFFDYALTPNEIADLNRSCETPIFSN